MPDPGDIFNAAVQFAMQDDVEAYNIYDFYLADGTATDAQVKTVLAAILTAAYAEIVAQVKTTVNLQEAKVNKVIWSGTEWIVDRIVGIVYPTYTPTNVGDMLPHAVAPTVTFNTTVPKRRGGKRMLGFCEDTCAGSTLTGGALAALAAFAAEIITPTTCGAGNLQYRVLTNIGTSIYPSAITVPGTVGSCRRRKPGVGA